MVPLHVQHRFGHLLPTWAALVLFVSLGVGPLSYIATAKTPNADAELHRKIVERGVQYLRTTGQAEDGSFSDGSGPGVTALVATALMRSGHSPDEPLVKRSLKYLQGFVRKDGGIYAEKSIFRNYETSMAVMCFVEANRHRPGSYDEAIKNADGFLKGLQYDEEEGHDRSSTFHGGTGYGQHKRPDLSNGGIMLDALIAAGNGADDEAVQRALIFVSRCQNLETEHNDTKWSAKVNDGSFYYTAAAGGSTKAEWPDGRSQQVFGLRGYGSMTYMGLKSLIYAGLDADDPRVKAASDWIRKNYTLEENPGVGQQGLYYYYHTFAKTFDVLGVDTFADAKGVQHDWRRELTEKLAAQQQADGSWINSHSRWLEADPNLVTGYALLALSYCQPQ